jgi:c-di-GMP-binding flagellar brake protein YcgR
MKFAAGKIDFQALRPTCFGRAMVERRNFPRVETSHPVLYFTGSYARPNVGWTVDLSLGGTRIESSNDLTPGDSFWIHVAIDHQTIKCRGKAIYVFERENGSMAAGVKFEELTEHDRLYLRQYISYNTEYQA